MKPRLLILTPTLGVSPYLEEAVESVRACRAAADIRHVLVAPSARLAELKERFPGCEVAADQGKEGGIYGALNAGLAAATEGWDWFTYINDDDALDAAGFSRLLEKHCRPQSAATVAYGDILNVDARGGSLGRMTVEADPRRIPALLQGGISPLGQQGMLFARDTVRALNEYRLEFRLCADLDFWARALAAGHRFVYYPWTVGRFRIQPGQLSGDVTLTRREQDRVTRESFPAPVGALPRRLARWNYRLRNAPRYVERWRAVGRLTTSDAMLDNAVLKEAAAKNW